MQPSKKYQWYFCNFRFILLSWVCSNDSKSLSAISSLCFTKSCFQFFTIFIFDLYHQSHFFMAKMNLKPLFMHTIGKFSHFWTTLPNFISILQTELKKTKTQKCHPSPARSDPLNWVQDFKFSFSFWGDTPQTPLC